MTIFAVTIAQTGPEFDPSLALEQQSGWEAHAAFMDDLVDDGFVLLGGPFVGQRRTHHVVEAQSEDAIRTRLARDPWSGSHLVVESIEAWEIRLDGLR
jgi:uncharacterized protein YciI